MKQTGIKLKDLGDGVNYSALGQLIRIRQYSLDIPKWLDRGITYALNYRINRAFKNSWTLKTDRQGNQELWSYSTFLKLVPIGTRTDSHCDLKSYPAWELQENT